jgi:lipoteichoic acid synthase
MVEATQQNLFLTLGNQLQELNYWSGAYHNHLHDFYDRNKTHVHLGYDTFKGLYGGLEGVDKVWTESDRQMIDATIGEYIDNQPFSVYYMTVSGHCMYSKNENFQAKKNYHLVEDMEASEAVKCYHAAQMELEFAMEALIGYLEEAGIADDTLIVMATDHYPYGLERSATWQNTSDWLRELYGVEDYDQFSRDHNALIIWSAALEDMDITVEGPVYSLDILPTVSNLMGIDYDSRLLVGRDVFSDEEPIVLWYNHTWKTELGYYDSSKSKFYPNEGAVIPEGYVDRIKAIVANKIYYSREVQVTDYFNRLSKDMKNWEPKEE